LPDNGLHDGANTDRALEIMREIKDRPFFLAVGFSKPHIPYVAPKKYWDLYDPQKIEFAKNQYPPKDAPAFAVQGLGELWTYDLAPQPSLPDGIKRSLIHGYLACISYIDTQVGRLLAELDRLGLRESTIVIAWGDNGYQLGEHGMWSSKHTCYETSALVPLIVGLPGRNGGRKVDALVEFMDIYPTLAELCGLPLAGGLEGTSFRPLLDRPDRPWKKAAFNQYPRGGYNGHAIRTDRWRLVEWRKAGQAPLYELYDHQADPQENSNIAGRPEGAKVVEELAAQLKAGWQAARPA
jgi:arylsulfatase A-like enzyme